MKRELISQNSKQLGNAMDLIVYGEKGYPVVVFPTQDSPCTNFEDFGMIDTIADYIEDGKIQVFCASSIDAETWSDSAGDKEARSAREEAYYRYVCEELVPYVQKANGSKLRPLAMGCSMGATHSAIFALRRPDLFQGCIALSGVYSSQIFYGNWMDDTLYANDPCAFLPNMPEDHEYVQVYNQRQLLFCVGQGAWEEDGIRTQRVLDEEFERLGVSAWCDYWGFDVNHDWPWWKKQIRYFLPIILGDIEKTLAAEAEAAKPATKAPAKKPAAKKATTRKKAPATEGKEPAKVAAPKAAASAKAEKPAAAKPAAAKAATKAEAPKEAKPAAPKAAAAKPAVVKEAATKAVAKTEKPKAPAKAAKAAAPAKTEKPAAPAKTTKPPAKTTKAAAPAKAAAAKPAAKKTTK